MLVFEEGGKTVSDPYFIVRGKDKRRDKAPQANPWIVVVVVGNVTNTHFLKGRNENNNKKKRGKIHSFNFHFTLNIAGIKADKKEQGTYKLNEVSTHDSCCGNDQNNLSKVQGSLSLISAYIIIIKKH